MKNLDLHRSVGVITLGKEPAPGGRAPMTASDPGGADTDDGAIVRKLKAGDQDTLRKLLDRHWDPLVAFAQRTTGGLADAEDLAQTAFVRLWKKRESLKETGSLKGLLYTIVRNLALDEIRSRTRRDQARASVPPGPSPRTPYEDVQGAELHRLAASAVARLPERRREVFRLVREEGLTYREIAGVLDLSEQTVANHMSLALADLRTALKPYLAGNDRQPREERGPMTHREQTDG